MFQWTSGYRMGIGAALSTLIPLAAGYLSTVSIECGDDTGDTCLRLSYAVSCCIEQVPMWVKLQVGKKTALSTELTVSLLPKFKSLNSTVRLCARRLVRLGRLAWKGTQGFSAILTAANPACFACLLLQVSEFHSWRFFLKVPFI